MLLLYHFKQARLRDAEPQARGDRAARRQAGRGGRVQRRAEGIRRRDLRGVHGEVLRR